MLHMRVLQGAGNRDYCVVATQGVSKRNPCWPGWRPAGGRGQCVYACHRALESSIGQTDASDFYNTDLKIPDKIVSCILKIQDTIFKIASCATLIPH